jgi:hypothetical protein
MPGVAFFGDAHAKERTSRCREAYGDGFFALRFIVDWCTANRVRPVSAGDLLDSPRPTAEELAFFAQCLRLMRDAGVPLAGILGNHEYAHVGAVSVYDALLDFERLHSPWHSRLLGGTFPADGITAA